MSDHCLAPPPLQVALARASPYVATPHRCAGLMLANHTSIRHLLDRTLRHYDKLMERKVPLSHESSDGFLHPLMMWRST